MNEKTVNVLFIKITGDCVEFEHGLVPRVNVESLLASHAQPQFILAPETGVIYVNGPDWWAAWKFISGAFIGTVKGQGPLPDCCDWDSLTYEQLQEMAGADGT